MMPAVVPPLPPLIIILCLVAVVGDDAETAAGVVLDEADAGALLAVAAAAEAHCGDAMPCSVDGEFLWVDVPVQLRCVLGLGSPCHSYRGWESLARTASCA